MITVRHYLSSIEIVYKWSVYISLYWKPIWIWTDLIHKLYCTALVVSVQSIQIHSLTNFQEISYWYNSWFIGFRPNKLNWIVSQNPTYGVHHFKNGISALSQISGIEWKNMGHILLGCLVGSNMSNCGITAVYAILDFIYLAQHTTHDDDTLFYMTDALKIWHSNKSYFIQVGSHADFNIPKFHSLEHYVEAICFLGAPDNFNTEMFERLHIDFAKKGWRASNKHDDLMALPPREHSNI